MKAITRTQYGPPELLTIREVEKPTPKDNEVLIRVHAATVNRTDCGILWAKPFLIRFFTGLFKPSSPIPGTDFAGQIEAIGKNVTTYKVGDKVWGVNTDGLASHAQYMTFREDRAMAIIPEGFSYAEAAASGEGAFYAHNCIQKVRLQPGQRVLVNGATGAIGSAAVQLLKYFGATVTATCATPYIELIKGLGADKVVDYTQEDFTQEVFTDEEGLIQEDSRNEDLMQAGAGGGAGKYHFIIDAVGKSSFGKCKRLLRPGGVYMSSELGPRAENLYLPLLTRFSKRRVIFPIPVNHKRSVALINKMMQEGKFRAVIDRTYPMEEIAAAYYYVVSGQKIGNVIIGME